MSRTITPPSPFRFSYRDPAQAVERAPHSPSLHPHHHTNARHAHDYWQIEAGMHYPTMYRDRRQARPARTLASPQYRKNTSTTITTTAPPPPPPHEETSTRPVARKILTPPRPQLHEAAVPASPAAAAASSSSNWSTEEEAVAQAAQQDYDHSCSLCDSYVALQNRPYAGHAPAQRGKEATAAATARATPRPQREAPTPPSARTAAAKKKEVSFSLDSPSPAAHTTHPPQPQRQQQQQQRDGSKNGARQGAPLAWKPIEADTAAAGLSCPPFTTYSNYATPSRPALPLEEREDEEERPMSQEHADSRAFYRSPAVHHDVPRRRRRHPTHPTAAAAAAAPEVVDLPVYAPPSPPSPATPRGRGLGAYHPSHRQLYNDLPQPLGQPCAPPTGGQHYLTRNQLGAYTTAPQRHPVLPQTANHPTSVGGNYAMQQYRAGVEQVLGVDPAMLAARPRYVRALAPSQEADGATENKQETTRAGAAAWGKAPLTSEARRLRRTSDLHFYQRAHNQLQQLHSNQHLHYKHTADTKNKQITGREKDALVLAALRAVQGAEATLYPSAIAPASYRVTGPASVRLLTEGGRGGGARTKHGVDAGGSAQSEDMEDEEEEEESYVVHTSTASPSRSAVHDSWQSDGLVQSHLYGTPHATVSAVETSYLPCASDATTSLPPAPVRSAQEHRRLLPFTSLLSPLLLEVNECLLAKGLGPLTAIWAAPRPQQDRVLQGIGFSLRERNIILWELERLMRATSSRCYV